MRVCDVFNVYLRTNTTRLWQWSIYIRVGSILVYTRNTRNTFRTHSAHIRVRKSFGIKHTCYMHLWCLGIKHRHVHCFLSPDTYAFVWFFVILHPHYAFVTKPYIPPEKSKINPGTHEMHIVVRRAHIVVCVLSLGCLRPLATRLQPEVQSFWFDAP